jgi:type 1 glutamine amidotransferase
MLEQELKRVVKLTSHTQRNWDVSVPFPQPHTKKIVDFAINCPTKNGINYYDLIVVTDDSIKKELYHCTKGYTTDSAPHKNSQILAPLLLVWVSKYQKAFPSPTMTEAFNNDKEILSSKFTTEEVKNIDEYMREMVTLHVGISSAYANIMAGSLGYKTGFCRCFSDHERIKYTLGIDQKIELMLGIGEANETLKHFVHHEEQFEYGRTIKEPVKVINL